MTDFGKRPKRIVSFQLQEELNEASAFLSAGQETGWVKPNVGREYSIEDAENAHVDVINQSGASKGKLVLNIN